MSVISRIGKSSSVGIAATVVCCVLLSGSASATSFTEYGTSQHWYGATDSNGDGIPWAYSLSSNFHSLLGETVCNSGLEWELDPDTECDGVPFRLASDGYFVCESKEFDGIFWGAIVQASNCTPLSCLDADGNLIVGCSTTATYELRLDGGTGIYEGATGTGTAISTAVWAFDGSGTGSHHVDGDMTLVGGDPPNDIVLEVPAEGSTMNGIGLISGWSCLGSDLRAEFRDAAGEVVGVVPLAHGTPRDDTAIICADSENGFSATVNWNLLPADTASVHLIQNDKEVAMHHFSVMAMEEEFTEGMWTVMVPDFPMAGQQATVEWDMAQQRFVVTGVQ